MYPEQILVKRLGNFLGIPRCLFSKLVISSEVCACPPQVRSAPGFSAQLLAVEPGKSSIRLSKWRHQTFRSEQRFTGGRQF